MLRVNQLNGFGVPSPQGFTFAEVEQRAGPDSTVGGFSDFNDCEFGNPELSRRLILITASRTNLSIVNPFIGEVAATFHLSSVNTTPSPDIRLNIWSAHVSSGKTGRVRLDYSGSSVNSVQIVLFRTTRTQPTLVDTGSDTGITLVSTTIDVATNGLLVAGCVQNQLVASAAADWSGMTERGHFNNSGDDNCSLSYAWNTGVASEVGKAVTVSGGSTERALGIVSIRLDNP